MTYKMNWLANSLVKLLSKEHRKRMRRRHSQLILKKINYMLRKLKHESLILAQDERWRRA